MKTKKRILKAGLWAGLLLVMSCIMPMVSAVFPVFEGFASQAFAAKIDGTVFNDTNQNGVQNTGETGISGVTVTLDGGTTATTDGTGAYTFNGVNNGSHTLSVTDPTGYVLTTNNNPTTFNVQGIATVNFGYAPITTTTTVQPTTTTVQPTTTTIQPTTTTVEPTTTTVEPTTTTVEPTTTTVEPTTTTVEPTTTTVEPTTTTVEPTTTTSVANDDFATATEITGLPFTDNTTTGSATVSPDDPSDCYVPYNTVWIKGTSDSDLVLEANTFGSTYDTTLTVVTGSPGNFTLIACNDDAQGGSQSQVIINVSANVTYYFMVGSKVPGGGQLTFNALVGGVVTTTTTVEPTTTTVEPTTTTVEPTTTTVEPTTTTTAPADCITIEPNSVEVSGTDQTLDVIVTFIRSDVIELTPTDLDKLVIDVDTTCAPYVSINSSFIIIGTTEVTADLNITVQGDAPSSQCSIKVSDPEEVADPPLNCEATFTITQALPTTTTTIPTTTIPTTTTTVPTTTTTIPGEECLVVDVVSTILPLRAGLLPHVRRIVITGENSNWDRTSAVSIEDIPIVIPLRVQPNKIYALMVIPSTLFGRFTPGEKEVGVATGAELCTGTVDIP